MHLPAVEEVNLMAKNDITKSLDKITDTLDDINKKLDHIIKRETEDFLNNRQSRWQDDRF